MDQLFGQVEKIVFYKEETGFTVARLKEPKKETLTTVVGLLPPLQVGESVRCSGIWKSNPKHGMQFEASECTVEMPADLNAIQRYLESGLIYGIGPVYAKRILELFGNETLKIIDAAPQRLLEVEGIGKKKVERIQECWASQKSIRDVMLFLQSHGISPHYAQRVYRVYGHSALATLKQNPYALARDIHGIGFKTADEIAGKMGFTKESSYRIESGIEFLLGERAQEGHVCYPLEALLNEVVELLGVEASLVTAGLTRLCEEDRLIQKELFVWLKRLYLAEMGIARELQRLLAAPSFLRSVSTEKALAWVQGELKIVLAERQSAAVAAALTEKLHLITGGPGTGKSTITRAILTISSHLTSKILLAAPTGRAAKRMSQITGYPASTIHALLQYDFKRGGFKHNRGSPLECSLLIVDEASMIDTLLMYDLLKAIPDEARVLFIGDIHQLPSVGPGNVLRDLIDSSVCNTTRLEEIFRQAAGSKIITNAHKINRGEFPDVRNEEPTDFYFIPIEEPEEALQKVVTLIAERVTRRYGFDPIDDVQVLAPMKRGVIGIEHMNGALQEALNPGVESLMVHGVRFGVGDKVMQTRNNYLKEVYNGDIGRILEIDHEKPEVVVAFDDRQVRYSLRDLDEVVLAYAISIHKSQGSEFPCVVILMHTSHFAMLHRNLLYTAVTRGKKLVLLLSNEKALSIALGNDEVRKRYTGLREQLILEKVF